MPGKYIPEILRAKVIERAKARCKYCQCWMHNAIHTFHIDHIISQQKDGQTTLENLALSCGGCNSGKWIFIFAIDPVTKTKVPIFNPRQHQWLEHFTWSDDFLRMIGLTPIGRATIIALKLNRKGVVNMRRLTIPTGEHPPKMDK